MKTNKRLFPIAILTTILLFNTSCKKDRIEPAEEPPAEYTDVSDYLNNKKQQEQDFEITDPSNDTIIGNQGTKLIISKNCLHNANGDTIDYPFTIHLVELYTPKDMIYWEMPSVANGNILQTDGEIRVRATKNGQDLTLVCPFTFEMPNSAPNSNMTIFTGSDNGNFVDWSNSGTAFTINSYGYSGTMSSLGWRSAAIQIGTGSGHNITFASQTDNLTNVGIFIYVPTSKTVMQVYNLTSGLIPSGSAIKIIMMAQDSNGDLFSYTESRTVNNSATINMTLTQTTDAVLTTHLDGL